MKHNKYVIGIDPYALIDGVENTTENAELAERTYEDLIKRIVNNADADSIMISLNDLLYETARNHFCEGFKLGMKLVMSLENKKTEESEF